ncbi:hypothetical protein AMTRI_Chr11g155040 [Amborella trichopoda]|uniref:TOD1/MUCI70 glycosyltransferase-like domain-containing protein n=1 Tax=Amborella trichopoda TaxID=13333 RepID=W1PX80_AMBTC|nr:uncharacterized protein LOC18441050 [Amborella trichopoda]ERN12818.1 hypothetical protein AMTR_s00180p00023300 [Amborella trichopoda]|eukprot:XP_006851237.1 uncharacterized protein LOC18441050 [Amborella trichopoda]
MALFRHGGTERGVLRVYGKRGRRFGRHEKGKKLSIGGVIAIFTVVLLLTFLAFGYVSRGKNEKMKDYKEDSSNGTSGSKVLKFGHGFVSSLERDSRDWDRDDRRRDDAYNEDTADLSNADANNNGEGKKSSKDMHENSIEKQQMKPKSMGLYNEAGRHELDQYRAEYEASLHGGESNGVGNLSEEEDLIDEYDDGFDAQDTHHEDTDVKDRREDDHPSSSNTISGDRQGSDGMNGGEGSNPELDKHLENDSSIVGEGFSAGKMEGDHVGFVEGGSSQMTGSVKKSFSKKKGKRHKFAGASCDMKLLNSTAQLVEPLQSKKFSRFSLQYTEVEERPSGVEQWEPRFAGHQTLREREETFYARDQRINCGFVKAPKGYPSTGFDLAEDDMKYMQRCHIAVSSCIFGNSDNLRTPTGKMVSRLSRKNVCFVMFVDENTLQTLSSEGQKPDTMGYIGLWKIVVVRNLPYTDMRRVGKIPKFLTHRLFPAARYSIWLDSKLRLQRDPLLILEYFLWRHNYEYAISNHYDRHCVWEEVLQNKKLNKFNHTIIDQQFAFYQHDGLKRFNASDPDKFLPSYVPEGSFIIRAHTPMSNLFSCLWFNEVDRFTPRDQLSFAYTSLKLRRMNPGKPFYFNMFKDCERRSIAKLFHHRSEEKRNLPLQADG